MSYFFSRVALRLDTKKGRNALVNQYGEHQLLWDLFPNSGDRKRDFLFRRLDTSEQATFYIVSQRPPEPSEHWLVDGVKTYQPNISEGMKLAFDLRVNPVITTQGKRHDVVMHRKQQLKAQLEPVDKFPPQQVIAHEAGVAWLQRQGQRHGFLVEDDAVLVGEYRRVQMHKPKAKHAIQMHTLDFSGVLEVTDKDAFASAILNGIGPAKAFGCGLLLVRPV